MTRGLSQNASLIIESFSTINALKDYYLIGGTALSLQIDHRLSEDLDFCKWVPDTKKVQHAVDPQLLGNELRQRFEGVDENHLGFSQVNYLVSEPPVKLSFYHTDLRKPELKPVALINNIKMADLKVLGGSKMYVVTQRTTLRDFYDIMVLLKGNHTTLEDMQKTARTLSSDAKPKKLSQIFEKVNFNQIDIDKFQALEPKFTFTVAEYTDFFRTLAKEIKKGLDKGLSL
jgi:hypothetical protein